MKSAFLLSNAGPSDCYTRGMLVIYIYISTMKISSSMTSSPFVSTLEGVKAHKEIHKAA